MGIPKDRVIELANLKRQILIFFVTISTQPYDLCFPDGRLIGVQRFSKCFEIQ